MEPPEHLAETKFAEQTQPPSPGGASPPPPAPGSATPGLNTPGAPGGSSHVGSRVSSGSRGGGSRGGPVARFISGDMFGTRFRIVELLGRGGMGEVYRAEDLELTESIALKFLSLEAGAESDWVTRFRQEVRLSRNVAHPNICRVYDIIELNDQWCLSMEYIAGESLAQNLRRMGRPSPEKALELARQICSGLAAIHDAGLIHRDLKPANIMIDDRGRVRITDFGLAGVVHDIVGMEVRAGTPAYMSPEQLAGREVTQRSDIYALGLVLYELFTGKRTFDADSFVQWKKVHQETTPATPTKLVPDLDPQVERVILRCLAKDPAQRPNSALAVLAALPGGDPLAAALAAGETPSAELIAASGEEGSLAPAYAGLCVAIFVLAVAAVGLLNERSALYRLADLPKSREVLIDHGREIVKRFAPGTANFDDAGGFSVNDGFLAQVEQHDSTAQRWQNLRGQSGAVDFWFRSSPQSLVPNNVSMGRVTSSDPPAFRPGMTLVRLDPEGRLISFQNYLGMPGGSNPATAPALDWAELFDAAGLQFENFTPVGAAPLESGDSQHSWTARDPRSGLATTVTSQLHGHEIESFDVQRAGDATVDATAPRSVAPAYENNVWVILNLISIAAALVLARHHMRANRCSECGARRVAIATLIMGVIWWVLHAQHVSNLVVEFELIRSGIGRVLFITAWIWLLYLGLEPYVRRVWPDTLISWTRLLEGRWRNAAVGRDILIGAAAGAAAVVTAQLRFVLPQWLGLAPPRPLSTLVVTGLGDSAYLASRLFDPMLLLMPMFILFLLVLTRLVFRNRLACRVIVAGLLVVMLSLQDMSSTPWQTKLVMLVMAGINTWFGLWICTRFGLLALVAMIFVHQCIRSMPLTFDFSAWYAASGLAFAAVLALLVAAAFYISLGGRRLFREDLFSA